MHAKQIAPRTFFVLEPPHLKELASAESAVLSNGSSVGSDFLLNGVPWWINVFGEARHANLIKPVVNIAGSADPMPNRAHIETRSEHARGIRRAECLQIELL